MMKNKCLIRWSSIACLCLGGVVVYAYTAPCGVGGIPHTCVKAGTKVNSGSPGPSGCNTGVEYINSTITDQSCGSGGATNCVLVSDGGDLVNVTVINYVNGLFGCVQGSESQTSITYTGCNKASLNGNCSPGG
jgi:hypothetical protein